MTDDLELLTDDELQGALQERRRGRLRMGARAVTFSEKRSSKTEALRLRVLHDAELALYERPVTRGDCLAGGMNAARPCPWASCKYHLAVDVHETRGSVKLNFPDRELDELLDTCALDVADRGGITLEEVGDRMNLTRERVRQYEIGVLSCIPDDLMRVLQEVRPNG